MKDLRVSRAGRYGVAVVVVGLALLAQFALTPVFGGDSNSSPFMMFFAAVIIGAWFGGLGPGLLAVGLSAFLSWYFFLAPQYSFALDGSAQGSRLVVFALEGVVISSLMEAMHRSRRRAELGVLETRRHAERLREIDQRFRLLVEGVKDYAIFMLDPDGRVTSWNEGANRINGYEAREIIGEHFSRFYTREDLERGHPEEELRIAAAEGRYEEEGLRVRKDGSTFWASVLITPLWDERGEPCGFSKVVRDITERKKAEEETHGRARQQATVAELGLSALQNSDLYSLMDEAVNLVAKTLEVEYCKVLELLPGGDALLLRAGVGWKSGLVGQGTVGASTDSQAGYTLSVNGPVIVEDLRTEQRFSGPPLLHDHGVVSGISTVIRGIERSYGVLEAHCTRRRIFTEQDVYFLRAVANVLATAIERRRSEEELERSQERLELGQAVAELGTFEWDIRTGEVVLTAELEALYGIEPGGFSGRFEDWAPFLHPEDREAVLRELWRAVEEGEDLEIEFRIVRPDGEVRWIAVRGRKFVDEDGGAARMLGVNSDVTERRRAEEGLRLLAESGTALSSSLDYYTTLSEVARLLVPRLADWCAVDIVEDDGALERLAVAHQDPEKVRWALELQERYPPDPEAPRGVPQVLRTGRPELYPEITEEMIQAAARDEEHLRIIREVGFTSAMIVPLIAAGRTLGAISLVSAESGMRYGEKELGLAEELARRGALAVQNARLFEEAQREIAEREKTEEELRVSLKNVADIEFALDESAIVAITDVTGRITYVNDKFCEISKYARKELLGQDHRIINSGYHTKEFIRNLWRTIAQG
ncbi:MAG TPA: PAS domain S-box protein, partial [Rubrobacteraceae bacterium]|nr:PAS domain S-box protein [Rubrobacteraceae bacterium]